MLGKAERTARIDRNVLIDAIAEQEAAIEVIKLTRRFGEMVALNELTLSVPYGSIFGLLGPNGAGKSTLIKMRTTLLPPSSGTARVAGLDIVRQPRQVGAIPATSPRCYPR